MLLVILSLLCSLLNALDKLESVNSMYVGDSLRIDASQVYKVAVSNARILKVSKDGNGVLLINAKSRGNVTLHVWYKGIKEPSKYSFAIMAASVYRKLSEIKAALKDVKGIKIYSAGEKIYLTGIVSSATDSELINRLVASSKDVVNYTRLSDNLVYGEYSRLADSLIELGLYDVNVKKVENSLFLDAVARTKKQADNAEYYLRSNYPNSRFDLKIIPYQIDIDVKIVEITASESKQMGLDVPSEFNLSRHTVLSNLEVDSVLHLSEGKGNAKLVSNPSLSSNDGEPAIFHVGGSIPIKLSSRYTANIDWKNYGVILNFTPKVINDDTVELSINTEFSSIDTASSSTTEVPGFLVREVKTIVTLEAGKSVVISGLVSKNKSISNRGLPVISNIPLISDVFSSNDNNGDSTELAVIVTPMIRFRTGDAYIDKKLEKMLAEVLAEEV